MKPILIVCGGQWGSEAKGAIAGYLCNSRKVDYAVRTGATNAGHTVIYKGNPVKLQQLPVGFVNPNTNLVIGAGALIDPEILEREVTNLSYITGTDIRERLFIDGRAGTHFAGHAARSKSEGRHYLIGATGKGCSEALIDRIRNRGHGYKQFKDLSIASNFNVCNTESLLNYAQNEGAQLLLEGTQGQMLDLYLGPYPYVTHKQTGPAQWLLEAGLAPTLPIETVLVLRTFPIRVAGNSGPMPQETSWVELARMMNSARTIRDLPPLVSEGALREFEAALEDAGEELLAGGAPLPSGGTLLHTWSDEDRRQHPYAASELHAMALKRITTVCYNELTKLFEMTTVTRKLRRIAYFDHNEAAQACRQARPSWIALTFMNYVFPEYWYEVPPAITSEINQFVQGIEETAQAGVGLLSFGPADEHIVSRAVPIARY